MDNLGTVIGTVTAAALGAVASVWVAIVTTRGQHRQAAQDEHDEALAALVEQLRADAASADAELQRLRQAEIEGLKQQILRLQHRLDRLEREGAPPA